MGMCQSIRNLNSVGAYRLEWQTLARDSVCEVGKVGRPKAARTIVVVR
jgi:hypothetical protein